MRRPSPCSVCLSCWSLPDRLLLQLRLEPFQQLLRDVGELLVHLYDATLSALSQQSHSRMPAALLAQVSAPPIAAGDEAHEEWRRMADQVRAIRHAQNTPSSYDHQTRPDLPVEVREATMQVRTVHAQHAGRRSRRVCSALG